MEFKNEGSTEATLAVKNACIVKSKLCNTWGTSSSYKEETRKKRKREKEQTELVK